MEAVLAVPPWDRPQARPRAWQSGVRVRGWPGARPRPARVGPGDRAPVQRRLRCRASAPVPSCLHSQGGSMGRMAMRCEAACFSPLCEAAWLCCCITDDKPMQCSCHSTSVSHGPGRGAC